jgi:hypothetical protein
MGFFGMAAFLANDGGIISGILGLHHKPSIWG